VVVSWRSFDGKAMTAYAWVSVDDGKHFQLKKLGRSEAENDYPRLLRLPVASNEAKAKKSNKAQEDILLLWNTAEQTHAYRF